MKEEDFNIEASNLFILGQLYIILACKLIEKTLNL